MAALGGSAPTVAQTIIMQNGATLRMAGGATLDLNGATLDFGTAGETTRLEEADGGRVMGGVLTATRMLNAPSNDDVAGLGFVISSEASLGATAVTRGHAAQFGGENRSIRRYYDVAPASNSGLDATLTVHCADAELGGLTENELELFRLTDDGATWSRRGADGRDLGTNTVTLNGVDAFSRWTLGATSQPLPVELTTFDAALDGEAVQLNWETASETNNAGFDVERSRAGSEQWTKIGFVEGAGTANETRTYRYSDTAIPFEASRLSYRLRQVDLDGTSSYSANVEVRLHAPDRVALHAPYPNPFGGRTTIRYELPQTDHVYLAVFNMLGQRMAVLADAPQPAGHKEISFDARALPSGVYFIQFRTGTHVRTRKITVVR